MAFAIFLFYVLTLVISHKLGSKQINNKFLFLDYLVKFIIPLSICYLAIHLVMLPLTYLRILFAILNSEYKRNDGTNTKLKKCTRLFHFVSFLLLGIPFLLYSIICKEMVHLLRKVFCGSSDIDSD